MAFREGKQEKVRINTGFSTEKDGCKKVVFCKKTGIAAAKNV